MKNLKNRIVLMLIAVVVYSCIFDRPSKDVDSFYTIRNFEQFPVLPLAKPLKLHRDDQSKQWNIEYLKHSFKQRIPTYDLSEIGVDNTYIYGRIDDMKQTVSSYENGDYLFLNKYNTFYLPSEPREPEKDEIRIYPTDSTSKTFILPERWFVINVADSTTEAFFSKTKYKDYLKERGISGKMYNINKYHKQFTETGILPWFPDSIKGKLKK